MNAGGTQRQEGLTGGLTDWLTVSCKVTQTLTLRQFTETLISGIKTVNDSVDASKRHQNILNKETLWSCFHVGVNCVLYI
jgi:hypothetical protein